MDSLAHSLLNHYSNEVHKGTDFFYFVSFSFFFLQSFISYKNINNIQINSQLMDLVVSSVQQTWVL